MELLDRVSQLTEEVESQDWRMRIGNKMENFRFAPDLLAHFKTHREMVTWWLAGKLWWRISRRPPSLRTGQLI